MECNGGCGRHGALEAALEDPLDITAVRSASAGDGERTQAGGVHALGAMFLRAAQDAEHGAIAHLGLRITSERAAHDLEHVRTELLGPREHALGRPIAVVLV